MELGESSDYKEHSKKNERIGAKRPLRIRKGLGAHELHKRDMIKDSKTARTPKLEAGEEER